MPINVQSDALLTLADACRALPHRPHISTLHRWRLKGVRGVVLETCLIGGIRYTSTEALSRFIEETTAVADGRAGPNYIAPLDDRLRPHNRREQHQAHVAAEVLDRAGI